MKFLTAAVTAAVMVSSLSSNTATSALQQPATTASSRRVALLSTSLQATASHNKNNSNPGQLTEYMAKAHEEKLRAVKEMEQKKNEEIQNLKTKLKALKEAPGALATTTPTCSAAAAAARALTTSSAPANMEISLMTKEQLAQRLVSYQQFMSKYIVDSQMQKMKAVAAAEAKVRAQYESKLLLLQGTTTTTTTTTSTSTSTSPVAETSSTSSASNPAFEQRSAKVAAAAAKGKSRWGDLENQKIAGGNIPETPEEQATHINGEAHAASLAIPAAAKPVETLLFDKRNARVAAAGKAGKSRWGDLEIARASQAAESLPAGVSSSSTPVPSAPVPAAAQPAPQPVLVPPEVEAADHGLRADGGVGGPTLAERVNLGAQLLATSSSTSSPAATATAKASKFDQRNARIVAAGDKSRWGEMEIAKAQGLVATLPASSNGNEPLTTSDKSVTPIQITPEIEAADHGLRADGGVGGPTLAQRVNLGAALLEHA